MSSFNPYQKSPNFGSWGQDLMSSILPFLLMKKMFPENKTTTQIGQSSVPPQSGMGQMGAQGMMEQAPSTQNNGMVDYNALMQMLMMLGKR